MMPEQEPIWSEEEYALYLAGERHLYAWCLITYSDISWPSALEEASRFYTYQPPSAPYRGIVFHDMAWHWAMIKLFGEMYWKARPEFETPSAEYMAEAAHRFSP